MFKDLVLANRSYRKFQQDVPIEKETLVELVDLACNSASSSNRQPLKYILSCDPAKNDLIFYNVFFARKDPEVRYPPEGGKPSAYIMMLGDTEIAQNFSQDLGIAAQSILLGATEKGLGGCMVMMMKRDELIKILNIDPRYRLLMAIGLGKPDEKVVLEGVSDGKTMFYWEGDVRRVPKRALEDVIVASYAPQPVGASR